ncbi:tRNA (guanosine(37)-N1)-methyltransferase TrmD [Cerasicoccus arenae]|uniref:tRNA (guanine-N(1)-)-methyltransferase n=1 Tax=Cerasicoccus arenae TaxID=424488 RepID=A0A8J3DJP3_9BACT|nr:tRNA (guanosine(37)-N1)-methyltransferase TrmD [Cerasicoccus arenae]MBK1858179.1 tRNA (guanosine(37)-N1)-methyltransferase TrmD [Cerasicoccus arenae]GHC01009.1 tRNA (guanine-N(1)-)-methyltransferase [Cerasicoccus arenae]
MRFDLITLFPRMAEGYLQESMLGQATKKGLLDIGVHDLRDWSQNKHKTADDRPFGGGAGMLLSPEPLFLSIEEVATPGAEVIYLCPDGETLSTPMARELAAKEHIVLVSGHYEGIDQRVRDTLITREVSIGDYVLTNGTLPACVLIDCVARYIPDVLGEEKSLTQDSFSDTFLGFPQFTRPADFRGMQVPEVLLSGDHAKIDAWRREQSLLKTKQRRPDLLEKRSTSRPSGKEGPQ